MGQTILREDFFMLFSDNPRVHYKKAQLAEVIEYNISILSLFL